jgi:hypothetical protein
MNFISKCIQSLFSPIRFVDVFSLLIFTVAVIFQPFFMHGDINFFETGIYLPAIDGVLHGKVLYRDIFYLRGPMEVYVPALLMKLFGEHLNVLYSYFYVGNVLCLILSLLIAREILQTRFFFYLLIPVLIGRTFPRVVFMFWGGMRFAFGLLAILCTIRFIKKEKNVWIFLAGIFSALSMLTSLEMGFFTIGGISAGIMLMYLTKAFGSNIYRKSFLIFVSGISVICLPYAVYLLFNQSLGAFIQSVAAVVTQLPSVFDPSAASEHPKSAIGAFVALANPFSKNFRHMTPVYLYMVFSAYFILLFRRKWFRKEDLAVMILAGYGALMYLSAFRAIWGAQFEMALQPEKIILFFLLELICLQWAQSLGVFNARGNLVFVSRKNKVEVFLFYFCLIALIGSSLGYSIARYNKRFWSVQFIKQLVSGKNIAELFPQNNAQWEMVDLERVRGLYLSKQQAQELNQLNNFLSGAINSGVDETIFMYPELGTYHFIFDKPFLGRFPMASFSWFHEKWHNELMRDLKEKRPQYAVVQKELLAERKMIYFSKPHNLRKYEDVMKLIENQYKLVHETVDSKIYQLR